MVLRVCRMAYGYKVLVPGTRQHTVPTMLLIEINTVILSAPQSASDGGTPPAASELLPCTFAPVSSPHSNCHLKIPPERVDIFWNSE